MSQKPNRVNSAIRRIRIPAGTRMTRRGDSKTERTRNDMITLGMPTTLPDGSPGWSFKRRDIDYWYVSEADAEVLPEEG